MKKPYYRYEKMTKRIHPDWLPFFESNKQDLIKIFKILNDQHISNLIYPNRQDIFRALFYSSPKDIRLVILGQDPYISEEYGKPQAMGLSFSIPKIHRKIPPSLKNIFNEIKNCYPNYIIPKHGLLKRWARKENILMLNSALTVIAGKSNSHMKLWQDFTDKLIEWFQENNEGTTFLLMGNFAKSKKILICTNKHTIFETAHPSPLSAYTGFNNSNIFKMIDEHLINQGKHPIMW